MNTDVFEESVASEMADLLNEAEEGARAREGDVLGEANGIPITMPKKRTMVHRNGVELPERTKVYDKRGYPSWVPTAQLGYHLNKRTPDGERAFYSRPPAGVTPPEPIDAECKWCTKRAGRKTKVFFDIDDYENHCENLHPSEWARKLRREEMEVRKGPGVEDVLKLVASLTPEQKASLLKGVS